MDYRRIIIGQLGTDQVVDFAVSELEKYLLRMDSGLTVDILLTDRAELSRSDVLWVGLDSAFPLPEVPDRKLDDGISIQVSGYAGYITGTNERSVLIAVYRFLKELGCCWLRPGPYGERIPQKALEPMEVSVLEAPSYRHRCVVIEGSNTYQMIRETIDYLPKVGLNAYYIQFLVPMAFFTRWYDHESNPHLTPEPISRQDVMGITRKLEREIKRRGICYQKVGHGWTCESYGIEGNGWYSTGVYNISDEVKAKFALVNGKRELRDNVPLNTNLCYSDPEVRKTITETVIRYCRENPAVDVLCFALADGSNCHCECDNCRKMTPSEWYVVMLNELDAAMTEAGLDTRINFCLYVDLLWAPQKVKLENPDRFILEFAPITRDYDYTYSDCLTFDGELKPFVLNRLEIPRSLEENLAHLRSWQEVYHGDSLCFDYHLMWAHIADPGYEKCARSLFGDVRDLQSIGLNGFISCQVQRSNFPTALPVYMMAQGLWDRESDFDGPAQAYYQAAYGQDWALVRNYLSELSERMKVYGMNALGKLKGPFCEDYEKVYALLDAFLPVIERNVAAGGVCKKEWENLLLHRQYAILFVRAFEALEKKGIPGCTEEAEALLDFINRNELTLFRLIDGHNTVRVLKGRFGLGTFGVANE